MRTPAAMVALSEADRHLIITAAMTDGIVNLDDGLAIIRYVIAGRYTAPEIGPALDQAIARARRPVHVETAHSCAPMRRRG